MDNVSVVEAARRSLGPVGVYLPVPFTSAPPLSEQREAAVRLEQAGYRAAWVNEPVGGKDTLVQAALLLEATERLTFGTGIVSIWARAPQTAHGGAAMLAQAYPGRLVLGIGVGYPQQAAAVGREYGRPVAAMRDYLERMTAPGMTPAPDGRYARIVAAGGPRLRALAAELADGIMPAGQPPSATAEARAAIGPDKLLVVGMSVALDSAEPDATAALAAEHRAAGADHVVLLSAGGGSATLLTGTGQLEALAPAMLQVS